MLSVIIPTEGVEQPAVATLAALVPGAAAGVVREVLLVDRSGSGVIERVADVAGCRFLPFEGSHAAALAAGARQARSPWLMFLHAGAVLDSGWIEETAKKGKVSREDVSSAVRKTKLSGITGEIAFDAKGDRKLPLRMIAMQRDDLGKRRHAGERRREA